MQTNVRHLALNNLFRAISDPSFFTPSAVLPCVCRKFQALISPRSRSRSGKDKAPRDPILPAGCLLVSVTYQASDYSQGESCTVLDERDSKSGIIASPQGNAE